jgi:hypothetical protein
VRYFDKKFLPYIFVGSGFFYRDYASSKSRGDVGSFNQTFNNGSAALYYGAGWDCSAGGLKSAIEFSVRNGSEFGQTFEVSLSFGFR